MPVNASGSRPRPMYEALIDAEATAVIGAQRGSGASLARLNATAHAPRTFSTGLGPAACDPPAAHRLVLPLPAGPAPPRRPRPVRGHHERLPARCEHPQVR